MWLQLFLLCGPGSPEDGQTERPQHQGLAEVEFGPLPHEVLASEYECSIQAAEHERLAPGNDKTQPHNFHEQKREHCAMRPVHGIE